MTKTLRYAAEAVIANILYFVFFALGPDKASAFGGWLGRTIGPKLAVNRKALRHLELAIPEISETERIEIIKGMWDNIGRVMAEYPHLAFIAKNRTTLHGFENHDPAQSALYVSGHLANWEICGPAAHLKLNIPLDLTYRPPNNPWTASLLDKARTLNGLIKTFPKSRESGRLILDSIKSGRSIGILFDQKYNEGIESTFFNMPAMTNPIFVQLCQKYKCPLLMFQIVRTKGCNFEITLHPSIPVFDENENSRAVADVIADAHRMLEDWIRQNPSQWTWMHKRWKS